MLLHSPLATITPTVDGDVLAALAGAKDWFTIARLHHLTPARSREGIRNALARLAAQGVVDVLVAGTTRSYQLNHDHLAAPAIIALASMKAELLDRLRQQLEQWSPAPTFAGVFGSAATGTMSTSSDIDLFLLHPGADPSEWDDALDALTARARRWTGNPVNALVMTIDEARHGAAMEPVLQDIANEVIPLIGTPRAFRQLTGAHR